MQRISIQNEPKAVQTMGFLSVYCRRRKEFPSGFPLSDDENTHGFENIEVFIWDHNKERIYERVRDTVDEETREMVSGAAFQLVQRRSL